MRTPAVLRAVKASMPSAAPAAMVISGSIESASVPRAGVAQGEIVEDEEHREEQDAERRDRDPVAPARPRDPQGERQRPQAERAAAEADRRDRDRIGAADEIARRDRRTGAERAGQDRDGNAKALVHGCSFVAAALRLP